MRALSVFLGVLLAALSVTATAAQAQEKAAKPKPAVSAAAPINLNTATAAQLEALPGIGPRTAQLIVQHREKNGNFKKVEELMNIKGIGEKSFLKIKSMVTVGGEKDRPDQSR
jgi:competence protein ComEA